MIVSAKNVSVKMNVLAERNVAVPIALPKRRGEGYFIMNKYLQAMREYFESKSDYRYEDPRTGEVFIYSRKGTYKKNGRVLVYRGIAEDVES